MEKSTDKLQVQENTVEVSELKKLCNITSCTINFVLVSENCLAIVS